MGSRVGRRRGRRCGGVALAVVVCLSAMPGAAQQTVPPTGPWVAPLQGQPDAGSYLAARAADRAHDFGAASEWFLRALADDPQNPELLENCITALIGMGSFERAQPLAARLAVDGADSQIGQMVLMANAGVAGDWARLEGTLDAGRMVSPLIDGLARGWALVAQGQDDAALAAFDALIADPDMMRFGLYHKALALMVTGDLRGADALLSAAPGNGMTLTRRSLIVHAQILSQLGQPGRAREALSRFGAQADDTVTALRAALDAGEVLPLTLVTSSAEGLGEAFNGAAKVLLDTAPPDFVLIFARTAERLHPRDAEYRLMSAGLLDRLGRFALAGEVYASVPAADPLYRAAGFGRAEALRRAGEGAAAVTVLQGLAALYPDLALAHSELADTLRLQGRGAEALESYDAALALIPDGDRSGWRVRFLRGVTAQSLGDWPAAEADLRAAYALNPDDAGLLNFLGYGLVERGENLDEALAMIVRAVEMEPEDGAILDSYGWALYRLGRVQEAVVPMERAALLTPENAVVNDHLGDVYWSVGRILEAHFQWRRALSFTTDEGEAAAIRAKLEDGLATGAAAGDGAGQNL